MREGERVQLDALPAYHAGRNRSVKVECEDSLALLKSHRAPMLLNEMLAVIAAHFRRAGASEEKAEQQAAPIVRLIGHHFGGRQVYLPKGALLAAELRNHEIYRRNTGRNTHEIAEEFGITDRAVQMICARQREIGKRMRDLLPAGTEAGQ